MKKTYEPMNRLNDHEADLILKRYTDPGNGEVRVECSKDRYGRLGYKPVSMAAAALAMLASDTAIGEIPATLTIGGMLALLFGLTDLEAAAVDSAYALDGIRGLHGFVRVGAPPPSG